MKTLLLGDLSPTASTNPLFEKHDIETLFSDTLPHFEGNDINFVNMECVLTDSEKAIEKFDKGWYSDHAVRYRDGRKIFWLVKIEYHV